MNKKLIMPIALVTLLSLAVFVSAQNSNCNKEGFCVLFEGEEVAFNNYTISIDNFYPIYEGEVIVENKISLIVDNQITNVLEQREKWFNQDIEIYINEISPSREESIKGEVRFQVNKYESPKNLEIKDIEFGENPQNYIPNSGKDLMIKPIFIHKGLSYGDDFFMDAKVYDVDRNMVGGCGHKIRYVGEGKFEGEGCGDNGIMIPGIYIFEITLNTEEGWLDETDYSDNVLEKAICVGKDDCSKIEEVERVVQLKNSCQTCFLDDECYPIGYRKTINDSFVFCQGYNDWQAQIEEGSCQNNFECKSNVCIDGGCIQTSLIQKILNWFKRLFG